MAFPPGKFFIVDSTIYQVLGVVVYRFREDLLDEFVSVFILPFRHYICKQEILSLAVLFLLILLSLTNRCM